MKKNKKQRFINVWNKIKKPLMILSIVGNVLFLLFIIVGCVGTKKQTTQTNAENVSNLVTLRNTKWELNETITKSPKGKILYSAEDVDAESYAIKFTNEANMASYYIRLNFDFYHSNITGSYYGEYGTQLDAVFYYYTSGGGVWHTQGCRTITILTDDLPNKDYENKTLINWFLQNATLLTEVEPTTFTFLGQINYNGPFGQALDSIFINANNESSYTLVIDLPFFESNGQLFNQIKCWYLNGLSMKYIYNGMGGTNTNPQSWYFQSMEYINTSSGLHVTTNYRKFIVDTETVLTNGSTWIGESYRTLQFQESLSADQRRSIECFNNDSFSGFNTTSTDVGLGNVFTIMSQGFGGLTNIFKIQILPNITIGLLLFLPLIVIVIITIIRLVKR